MGISEWGFRISDLGMRRTENTRQGMLEAAVNMHVRAGGGAFGVAQKESAAENVARRNKK
jgi:hypothetical protein